MPRIADYCSVSPVRSAKRQCVISTVWSVWSDVDVLKPCSSFYGPDQTDKLCTRADSAVASIFFVVTEYTYNNDVICYYSGLCCRRHVVGQRVVSSISVVHSCWSICGLCSESNNTNLAVSTPVHCCTWNVNLASHTKHTLAYNTTWRHVDAMYSMTIDREFSDVTAPYLFKIIKLDGVKTVLLH